MDFHLPSLKEASNVFQLQCINPDGGLADPDARFEFNDSMGVFIRNTSTDVNEDYFIYDITEDFEASVRCTTGEDYSEAVMFYGIVTSDIICCGMIVSCMYSLYVATYVSCMYI